MSNVKIFQCDYEKGCKGFYISIYFDALNFYFTIL
ncbi:UNVERIFIED_ORG: hypothetical protein DFS12_107108 [Chitinophaga ginsengisegetis]|nr:hypothetical protein [Chitinophaga ginsengisegetis]MDR6649679.1 hypothetical protein [Chitinophaga ginsengisegetis]MDR6656118.1 hypothetical protein [Chitinophaga ginsengisegetis]